ncbi:3,4-dihydroxy-2-butanone-4-phosphate synthase [Sodalis-like secondary symbiont of Drepanosiphum platanoidis]|uniref:3,4-dihydroxy-2-butanone-4-phosphate synthase n=1 Tax=Sodalis-like secondary symbiont of Drepanosiphum platanoidis TaxID=2994493 RepID=UPI0034640A12
MNDSLIYKFGLPKERIENAIQALKNGSGILVIDDEDRENEGDMVFCAENMTVKQMALAIRHGSGIVCLCLTNKNRKKLGLSMMVKNNTSHYKTPFTVSIESAYGVTTGVSAKDRITTINSAIKDNAKPSDLNSPGHVFPLCAHPDGILGRSGHTEAAIELVSLSGMKPFSVLCEVTNNDGSMARTPEIIKFSKKYNMPIVTIQDLIFYKNNL